MAYRFSKRSKGALRGVHPDLVVLAYEALSFSSVDFGISEGVRVMSRQKELVAAGKSWTLNSRHLTGHAIDVFAWVDGKVSWDKKHYHWIYDAFVRASRETGIPFGWGGKWSTFDGPHFELPRTSYPKEW